MKRIRLRDLHPIDRSAEKARRQMRRRLLDEMRTAIVRVEAADDRRCSATKRSERHNAVISMRMATERYSTAIELLMWLDAERARAIKLAIDFQARRLTADEFYGKKVSH